MNDQSQSVEVVQPTSEPVPEFLKRNAEEQPQEAASKEETVAAQ